MSGEIKISKVKFFSNLPVFTGPRKRKRF